jgi:hypothetical protein
MSALTGPELLLGVQAAILNDENYSAAELLQRLPLENLTVFVLHIHDDDTALERFLDSLLRANSQASSNMIVDAPPETDILGFISDDPESDFALSDDETP